MRNLDVTQITNSTLSTDSFFKYLSIYCLIATCLLYWNNGFAWQSVSKGLSYKSIEMQSTNPFAIIHAFKLDLRFLALKYCPSKPMSSIQDSIQSKHAIMAFNGGFFDHKHHPLGLRVQDGIKIRPIKNISWWRVFQIIDDKPMIVSPNNIGQLHQIKFAVQSGPRLIDHGKIPAKLKGGEAKRTAVGITKKNEVIVAITEHGVLTTKALAKIMLKQLGCTSAINLDGGSSSQLYIRYNGFNKHIIGLSSIPDPICVYQNLKH